MSATGSLSIRQMIVHKLDHRAKPAPELASMLTPNDPKAVEFILKQIGDNREHRRSRHATFANPATNQLMQTIDALFAQAASSADFIAHSQVIAQVLFDAMLPNRKISPGDLVICLYDDGSGCPDPALALLKLDPQSGFRGVTRTIGSQTQVVLEEVTDVLASGELQKCAFVAPPSQRATLGHDLVVLDQQTGRFNSVRQVASFFVSSFLQCEVGLNRADLTYRFLNDSLAWGDAQPGWGGAMRWRFKERVYQALANELVDVVAVAEEMIAADDEREAYIDHLRDRGLRELTFRPDPEMRERLSEYIMFEGDDGLRLRVRQSALEPGGAVTQDPSDDGSWTITIRTNTWRSLQSSARL